MERGEQQVMVLAAIAACVALAAVWGSSHGGADLDALQAGIARGASVAASLIVGQALAQSLRQARRKVLP